MYSISITDYSLLLTYFADNVLVEYIICKISPESIHLKVKV